MNYDATDAHEDHSWANLPDRSMFNHFNPYISEREVRWRHQHAVLGRRWRRPPSGG